MKAGSFCNEVLGQKGLDAGGATLPEKGNQSGQLLGGPAWGHLTCQGASLPGPSVRGAGAAPPSVVPTRAAAARNTGRTVDSSHGRTCSAAVPLWANPSRLPSAGTSRPALRRQTHLERGSW